MSGDANTELARSLIGQAQAGDVDAQNRLVDLYREPLIRFCRNYLDPVEESEDATQEVLVKILEAGTVPDRPRAWIFRIARNHCLNLQRHRQRRPAAALPSDAAIADSFIGASSRLARAELHSRVLHLVASLPPHFREPLRLRYGEGLQRDEIAYVLGIRESVVKSRLYEGLNVLRGLVKNIDSAVVG